MLLSSFFRPEKTEKISFQELTETHKQIIESAYKIYFDACKEQTSNQLEAQRTSALASDEEPLYVNLEELIKKGEESTADGWAMFTTYILKNHQGEAPDMEQTKKAFEKAYKLGTENKNAAADIIDFDNLSEIQKNAWLTSARFLCNTELEPETLATPTCPSH